MKQSRTFSNLAPVPVALTLALTLATSLRAQVDDALGSEARLAGREIARLFEPVAGPVRASTVRVMRDGEPVALGVVVSADGQVVTKASEVQGGELVVILHDNRSFKAEISAVDSQNDLALIQIEARGLTPLRWTDGGRKLELGQWVVAPWPDGGGLGASVVSAHNRALPFEGGVMGIRFRVKPGNEPAPEGVSIDSIFPESGAETAGLQPGDVIVKINDQATPRQDDLLKAVKQHPPGETIRVTFRRNDQEQEVHVTLAEPAQVFKEFFPDRNLAISGSISRRRTGFTAVIQHHIPLLPHQCGGPLVDLDGRVIGLNIARSNRTDSYALPADTVREAINRLTDSQNPQQVSTETPQVPEDRR